MSRGTTSATGSGCSSAPSRTAIVLRRTLSSPPPWRTPTLLLLFQRGVLGFLFMSEEFLARCQTGRGLSSHTLRQHLHCRSDLQQLPQKSQRLRRCFNRTTARGRLGMTGVPRSNQHHSRRRRIAGPSGHGARRPGPLAMLPLGLRIRSRAGLRQRRRPRRRSGGDPGTPTPTGTGGLPQSGGTRQAHQLRRPPNGSVGG